MVQDPTAIRLRDCGHLGQYAGICQYQSCANNMCFTCIHSCEVCGIVLCPFHQDWGDEYYTALCPEHARRNRVMDFLRTITPGI